MSGAQTSSFYPVNQLLVDNAQQIQNYYAPRKNELLLQGEQQKISSNEMEVAARLAQGLLALPDETAMAAAYPNAVAYGQGLGFLKNAPSVFPGVDRLRQIASMGVSAEKQYEQQGVAGDYNAYVARRNAGLGTGAGTTTAAPGGGATTPGSYEGAIGGHEGTGRNPRSTAYGTGQFLESTWLNFAAENPEMFPGMSQQQILAARSNPALGNTAINWLAQKNAQDLQAAGVTPSGQSLGISHYLGSGAAAKIMQAGDAEPVRNFVSEAAVRANPELANMTVGQMKARYASTPNPSFMTATATPGGQTPAPYQTSSLTPTPPPTGATGGTAATGATTPAQGAAPAQQPPAAPAAALPAPPPPVGADGLNAQQRRAIADIQAIRPRNRAEFDALQKTIALKEQEYRDHNETVQRQYQSDVRLAQKDADAAATAQQTAADRAGAAQRDQRRLELSEQANQRAEQEAAEKAKAAGRPLQGNDIDAQHESTILQLADKLRRGETLTKAEQDQYDGAYYALQQRGGQTGTMSGPGGSTIPFQTTRKLPPSWPEPSGGALPPVISQPSAAKQEQATAEQSKAAGFADRIRNALPVITDTSPAAMSRWQKVLGQVPLGNSLVSEDFQQHMQAERDFINAILRRESGAAISPSEFENARQQYIPQPGDGEKVLAQKQRNRESVLNSLTREAGPTYTPSAAAGSGTSGASTSAPPLEQRRVGAVYPTPKGPMKWTGTGWLPAGE